MFKEMLEGYGFRRKYSFHGATPATPSGADMFAGNVDHLMPSHEMAEAFDGDLSPWMDLQRVWFFSGLSECRMTRPFLTERDNTKAKAQEDVFRGQ